MASEIAEPPVNAITPDHPHIVNPTGEFGPDSYIDTGHASPAKYPSSKRKKQDNTGNKKKKTKKGTIQGGVMTLVGLDKFKKDTVVFEEIPPTKDERGEIVEVQVLEEGRVPPGSPVVAEFDPDDFLDRLEQFHPQCPRCKVDMKYGSVPCPDGKTFEYYRCPSTSFYTKCYVTCSINEVGDYLKRVKQQTHPCYMEIDHARFRCECDKSLVLATSHSVKNPDWLYLKCPKRTCEFFQWINEPPSNKVRAILFKKKNVFSIDEVEL